MNTTVWSNSSMSPVVPNVSIFVRSLPQMRLIYQRMLYWVPLTVLLPGIVLNTLMACVFTRKRFWKNTTMGFYYTVHPICSNIALIVGMVAFLPSALGINLTSDLISCNFLISMRVVSIVGVEYFTVMMTIDRMVNILYPRRFPWLSKTRNLFKMTIGVYIVVFIYGFATQSLRSMTYTYVTVNNTTQVATATCNYLSNTVAASVNVSVCLVRVGGFVIIQIANTFIVRRLVVSKRVLRSSNLTPGNNQRISSKEFYFCMSLMAYNLIQLICVAPSMTVLLIQQTYAFDSNVSVAMSSFYGILFGLTTFGNYMFEAIIFWINLSTNKIFRMELFRLFRRGSAVSQSNTRAESTLQKI